VTGEHYFTASPQAAARSAEIDFEVAGRNYRLRAPRGVFSASRLDPGTSVLLTRAVLPGARTKGALLDLGCGYGPIACVLATSAPQATVYAVDVNERAVEATRANAEQLGLSGRIVASDPDGVPASVPFAQIWSNPPIRVGKTALHAMLDRWLPRLDRSGTAWLVVSKNLGGDSLARWLRERGWAVERHTSQMGFRVLRVSYAQDGVADENSGDGPVVAPENS
jgi:16S rRNA (guanine1207-N2)-methyltransferase